jgi:RNA polymerase sigma-70 factor (ECF subfamily)
MVGIAIGEGLTADDAVDAVQEAFVTFLALPTARGLAACPDEAAALLAVVVRNAARNARRRHHRAKPHVDVENAGIPANLPSADALVFAAEAHVAAFGCIQRLAELQRNVLMLRLVEELSTKEAAQALDLTPQHVAVLLGRAKDALRRCLEM